MGAINFLLSIQRVCFFFTKVAAIRLDNKSILKFLFEYCVLSVGVTFELFF